MKRRNFTLVEMIVSLGILLLVLSIAALATLGARRTWQTIATQDRVLKSSRTIDRLAESAFRNAVPFYWRDRDNQERLLFTGEPHTVTLSYLHPVDDGAAGGIRFLRLFREGKKLIAEYRQRPFLNDREPLPGMVREELADNVVELTFCYADRRDRAIEWYDFWDVEARRNLPLAIQMEIRFDDGSQQIWLRRTAGSGQFQQWGRRLQPLKP